MKSEGSNRPITFDEIAVALAKDYNSIYVIDAADDSYVEYISDGDNKQLIQRAAGTDFYQDAILDCSVSVHPDDKEEFLRLFKKENVIAVLKTGDSFSYRFRLMLGEEPAHYFFKTLKCTDDKVIVAVKNIDDNRKQELAAEEEMRTYRQIAGALASRYEVIYRININTNEYLVYSSSDDYARLGTTRLGKDFFTEMVADVKKIIYEDDVEYVIKQLDKKTLLKDLSKSKTVSLTYRQQLGEQTKYVRLNIVRPNDDKDHIVMGLLDINAQIVHEQKIMQESELFNNVAMALASRYEVIYRVNINTNEYYEFSSSEKYTKLEVGNKGDDFFSDTQRNMKRDIYEEDYPMMAQAMVKENILEQLKGSNKLYINYRLLLDGRPQFVSLVILRNSADSEYIIVAVENTDEAKRKEMEYEAKIGSAIDMANRDALTGVKNKHAYVTAETQMDEQIGKEPDDLEFAIAVCDLNGLKQVNDEQGHSAGDKYIRDACTIICEIFDHSPVYRIGGDEFVVILKGHDYEHRQDLLRQFYNKQVDNRREGIVTMAYGMAEFMPGKDLRVQDVFERADSLMYANKKRFKEQPEGEEAEAIESYSFIRFYELYEKLLSAMVDFDNVDVPLIQGLITRIGKMFRLCKGVTKAFHNAKEEQEGGGDVFIPFDTDKECREVISLRAVTSVLTSATCTVYMLPDEEPLSAEETEKVELVMRTILSFVTRNRMRDVVYELAYYDENGYPNLRTLNRELGKIVRSGSFKDLMAVRYNLRHFSIINQEFGRDAGDRVMKMHYDTLKGIMGEGALIARLGGDNFVGICDRAKKDQVVEFLNEAVINVDEYRSVRVPSSAGFFVPADDFVADNPGDIMGAIINAYNVAQSGGGERVIFYDDKLMAKKQKYARIQRKLADAIVSGEIRPFYQPKVDAQTGQIVGGEALCRWFQGGKIVPPDEFIPALEQTNDICDLDLFMLECVCRDQRKWLDGGTGRKLVPMSINFSRKNIMNLKLADMIESILDKYCIPHDAIEIELTETTTDVEFSDLKRVVTQLRDKGIMASIDDFGIGYSSLNLLRDIPWHTLKIDRSFIPDESDGNESVRYKMFSGVLSMARSIGLKCIAEGVETESQLKVVRETGCDIIQGYYYDKPLPKEEFESRLEKKVYEK
ncbi:MAG: GGDEF domain-containing protein [Clostridiales bacterium]|nr:GGDEF domain-containing protein [Clostridiales bacterium]